MDKLSLSYRWDLKVDLLASRNSHLQYVFTAF